MNPLVSVIISNYNYEQYISKAIESVLNQTYSNYELIIVDDGSTDNSRDIIGHYVTIYPEKVIPVYKENGGQASAFNEGYNVASGEIIAFLDADDYWYEDKLMTVVKYHEKYAAIQHNLLINNKKRFVLLDDKKLKQKEWLEKYGFMGTIPTSGLSYKKELLDKVFPIPEKEYRICADLYFKILALNYEEMFSINDSLGNYRVHGENNWFKSQEITGEYHNKTLKYLNEIRFKENKSEIKILDYSNSLSEILIEEYLNDILNFSYIIYGTGSVAENIYSSIKNNIKIDYFSGSYVSEGDKLSFSDLPVMDFDYLIKNKTENQKVIIGSSFVEEIKDYLINNGVKDEDLIYIRY